MTLATLADFEICGLRKEAFAPRRKAISSVDPTTNRLGVEAHGWSGNEPLQFTAIAAPGVVAALPGGLSDSVVYYPLPVDGSDTLFSVATSVGGASVDLTDGGTGTFYVRQQLGPAIARTLELISGVVEDAIPGDLTQTNVATWVVCKLAAYDLAIVQGLMDPELWKEGAETLGAQAKAAQAILDGWKRRGAPPRKPATDGVDTLQNGSFIDTSPPVGDGFGRSSCGEETIS